MNTAYFLGAGASAAEGAPVQSQLFREYFQSAEFKQSHDNMDRELATFFLFMFSIDVDRGDLARTEFPTFEEAIGILELAERRGESFKEFQALNVAMNSNRIGFMKLFLVLLMAKVIHNKLEGPQKFHTRFVENLRQLGQIERSTFLTTNYDILVDNALASLYPDRSIDYGIEFTNFLREQNWTRPGPAVDRLLKLHGSLNWLYCPTCNAVTLTPKEKGVIRLLTDMARATCPECGTVWAPIIVPPSFFKDFGSAYLSAVWLAAEHTLRAADRIVFCGYSLPDADLHIKYLVKRAQVNRDKPLKIIVCNEHPGKRPEERVAEQLRFKRVFGAVDYTDLGFEDLAEDPEAFIANGNLTIV